MAGGHPGPSLRALEGRRFSMSSPPPSPTLRRELRDEYRGDTAYVLSDATPASSAASLLSNEGGGVAQLGEPAWLAFLASKRRYRPLPATDHRHRLSVAPNEAAACLWRRRPRRDPA